MITVTCDGVRVEHQPDAAPGFEWYYSVPAPEVPHGCVPCNIAGTESTREAAVEQVNALGRRLYGRDLIVDD